MDRRYLLLSVLFLALPFCKKAVPVTKSNMQSKLDGTEAKPVSEMKPLESSCATSAKRLEVICRSGHFTNNPMALFLETCDKAAVLQFRLLRLENAQWQKVIGNLPDTQGTTGRIEVGLKEPLAPPNSNEGSLNALELVFRQFQDNELGYGKVRSSGGSEDVPIACQILDVNPRHSHAMGRLPRAKGAADVEKALARIDPRKIDENSILNPNNTNKNVGNSNYSNQNYNTHQNYNSYPNYNNGTFPNQSTGPYPYSNNGTFSNQNSNNYLPYNSSSYQK